MSTAKELGPKSPEMLRREIAQLVQEYAEIVYAPQPFISGESPVPVSGKVMGTKELQGMVEASLDGWLTTGRFNTLFENRLAKYLGVKHLITVNSGSSANLVAFSTLTSPRLGERAIQPGDEVISVAACFPTTVSPILQYGAVPVFVDVDPATHNIDISQMAQAITPRSKAVMLAHTLGNPFNLDAVTALCKKHNLWLIEDCCDALGSTYRRRHVGTFGDIATLSFYPAHHITMGEGGAVFTNHSELRIIATSMRDWGRDCYCPTGKDNTCNRRFRCQFGNLPEGYDHKYVYGHIGYNLKITDMQAACALAQLDRLDGFVAARKANFLSLKEQLQSCQAFLHLPEATPHSDPSWFGFPVTLKTSSGVKRVDLLQHLEKHKVGTRLLFAGNITRQPCMMGKNFRIIGDLHHTDVVMNQTFWLGVFPGLSRAHLAFMAHCLEKFFAVAT